MLNDRILGLNQHIEKASAAMRDPLVVPDTDHCKSQQIAAGALFSKRSAGIHRQRKA
ncbi:MULTISPECIES: hypothetical protein [Pseudomonas]|uniref:Uncharacterized protein n=1 Tax=Pseudomonas kielensis TaxID=2762577 RepID=A0A7X1GH24_9PSED|nr:MULTISPECIES: hypothetical protein [Pseudomonas]MBC2692324.1 hypothetical protein [Pseudomonas kielensis]NBB36028.1 hypothetical protein [Pseudomonas sp. BC115LW]UZM15886.1 hypothetical protein LZV00_09180 [Pseudomonas kielensis]WKL51911.1 hypothetical protein Q1W70_20980 [Pseudomonas kielensis]